MTENNQSISWLDRISSYLTKHRGKFLLIVLLGASAFSFGTLYIKGDVILQHMFPYNHPYLKLHAHFTKVFGSGASGVVICLKAKQGDIFNMAFLTKLDKMTKEIQQWDEVYRGMTHSFASQAAKVVKARGKGELAVESVLFKNMPDTPEKMEALKRNLFSSPAYNGIVVSGDGTAALIFTEFRENISYEQAHRVLRKLVADYIDENTSVHVIGFPALMGWIYSLRPQMKVVFVVSIAFILMILAITSRTLMGVLAPLIIGLFSTGLGLGFVGWTGINFSPLLYVLAFLVGARIVSHALQITHRYIEELKVSGNNKDKACYETMRAMIIPNLAGVITDAAGFSVLILAKIVLLQQIAIIMSFWMLSVVFSGVLTPGICTYIPINKTSKRWSEKRTEMTWLDRATMGFSRFSIGSGKYVVGVGCIAVMVFCAFLTKDVKIGDPTPGSPLLWPDHTYNQDQAMCDRLFDASSENFMLFYEGDRDTVYDPDVLNTFELFDRHMRESLPDIYKSSASLNPMCKDVNVLVHDGDQTWYQMPRNRRMMSFVIGWVRLNVGMELLLRYVDGIMERSQLSVFFKDHTSENLLRIKEAAYDFFKDHPMKIERGEYHLAGGRIGLEMAVNEEMKRSHLMIDLMVFLTIFLACSACFRSFVAGMMLTIPLIIANMVAFAYMVLNNIGLSINTLPVAAIGVGVGVDFAIYVYSRVIEEFPYARDWTEAIMTAVRTSGKTVVITGITLILAVIPWYFISELQFQAQMGFFLSMLLLTNVILSITLHPLLIYIIKPKFILRKVLDRKQAENTEDNPRSEQD